MAPIILANISLSFKKHKIRPKDISKHGNDH
jgi:hypothetical protein